jgi:hypothetical protein
MHLREIWKRITTTRYTRALEAFAHMECAMKEEIARLRAENRALLNSILGIAGIPPIVISEAEAATEAAMLNAFLHTAAPPPSAAGGDAPHPDKPESSAPSRVRFKTESDPPRRAGRFSGQPVRSGGPPHNISPMRRRSWQQINRMLEFASARKPTQET